MKRSAHYGRGLDGIVPKARAKTWGQHRCKVNMIMNQLGTLGLSSMPQQKEKEKFNFFQINVLNKYRSTFEDRCPKYMVSFVRTF